MAELEKLLKDILYAAVGAVSTAVDKGSELVQELVQKGRQTMEENQETIDNVKQKVKDACDSLTRIDVRALSEEEREDLREQLRELDEEMDARKEEARQKAQEARSAMDAVAEEAIDSLKRAAEELRKAMGFTDDDAPETGDKAGDGDGSEEDDGEANG